MRDATRLRFHTLAITRRLDDFIVSHEPTGVFLVVDEKGKDVLEALHDETIGEVKEQFPKYDVDGFIQQCMQEGLVHKAGHRIVTEHRHVTDIIGLHQQQARWVRNPLLKGTLIAAIAIGMSLLVTRPELAPSWDWFFTSTRMAMAIPIALMTFWGLQFFHELGHYLAMKATGHPTGFSIVSKWHLLLPRANINNIRQLEPQEAIPVHLAGIVMDLLMLSIAVVLLILDVWTPFARLVVLLLLIELLLQLAPIKHSDLSRAIEHAYGIKSLPATLKKAAKNMCIFCKNRATLTPNESRVAASWLPLVALGALMIGIVLAVYLIPIIYVLLERSVTLLLEGAALRQANMFADGMLSLLLLAVLISLYSISLISQHDLGRHPWFAWASIVLFLLANYAGVFLISSGLLVFSQSMTAAALLFLIGLLFGGLFLRLLTNVHIERLGFAKDTVLPVLAALTALLLMVMASWMQAYTGAAQPATIHAIAYATGMISAILL